MANTAQPNQPLIEHPLPLFMKRALGAGSTLIKGALPNTDTLLIPPPGVDPNGVVVRDVPAAFGVTIINNSAFGVLAAAGNFSLVYKNALGQDAILAASGAGLPIGGALALSSSIPFVLAPTDQGIFLRLGALLDDPGLGPFTGALDAFGDFTDLRDVTRVALDLTTTYQTLLSGVQGKARLTSRVTVSPIVYAAMANFDTVAHVVEARITDGVNTVQLPVTGLTPAGIMTALVLPAGIPTLLENWGLLVRTTVASATRPFRFILGFTDTNLAPVRTNQGGAF